MGYVRDIWTVLSVIFKDFPLLVVVIGEVYKNAIFIKREEEKSRFPFTVVSVAFLYMEKSCYNRNGENRWFFVFYKKSWMSFFKQTFVLL